MASAAKVEPAETVRAGVPPLRAGQGIHFWLRRLQSLSGIIPIGAFLLLEHFISNAFVTNGAHAYMIRFVSLPVCRLYPGLSSLAYSCQFSFISSTGFTSGGAGRATSGPSYPWMGNWMYTAQRWTGIIAFIYISYHVYTMRFSGVHLMTNSAAAFTKVYEHFLVSTGGGFLLRGNHRSLVALLLWTLAIRGEVGDHHWAERAEEVWLSLSGAGLALVAIGTVTMLAFLTTPASQFRR